MPQYAELEATGTEPLIPHDRPIVITIDGPAGTGKSSVARTLAARLGLDFLDTGAMYRASTVIALDQNIDIDDTDALIAATVGADLHFDWTADPPTILAWGKPINHRTRDADVTAQVSRVAAIGRLREHMVKKQRIIADQHPRLVTEGRDQGSVVFPDAELKFYLDARPEVRAARRAAQLRADNHKAVEAELLETIKKRDELDSSRADGPLICPQDAIVVDTSELSFDQVVQALERTVLERVRA